MQIDFIISNPGHHFAMIRPVIIKLIDQYAYNVRLFSLCEFRGLESPKENYEMLGVDFVKLVPFQFRSPSSGGQQSDSSSQQFRRKFARQISWGILLSWRFSILFRQRPNLVVLPNDAAFPYDKIVNMLHSLRIPYLLMQEGIRFPLPGSEEGDAYGLGGAAAIAAWGNGSAAYFRSRGVLKEKVFSTGNPRFDRLPMMDFADEANLIKHQLNLRENTLLFLSNPIDDQGFCSTKQKYDLISRFIETIVPLFNADDFRLVIKLHPRESIIDVKNLVNVHPESCKIVVLGNTPLYPLFTLSKAAIVLASTVGLEALMLGLPLGVLEIPETGFVFDYVEKGVALGLSWEASMLEQVHKLLEGKAADKQTIDTYLQYNLASIGKATTNVVDTINKII